MSKGIKFRVSEDVGQFYYAAVDTNGKPVMVGVTSYPTAYGAHRAVREVWESIAAGFDTEQVPPIPYTTDSVWPRVKQGK